MIKAAIDATIIVIGLFLCLTFLFLSITALQMLFGSSISIFIIAVVVIWVMAFVMSLEPK